LIQVQRLMGRRLTRRHFLVRAVTAGTGLVAAATFGMSARDARDQPTSDSQRPKRTSPHIVSTALRRCAVCNRLVGRVEEKYNGMVRVYCKCHGPPRGRGRNPSMVSMDGDRAMWTPTSDYLRADGKKWHVPYFVGFILKEPWTGFPLTVRRA
jgi:hypothetical protein